MLLAVVALIASRVATKVVISGATPSDFEEHLVTRGEKQYTRELHDHWGWSFLPVFFEDGQRPVALGFVIEAGEGVARSERASILGGGLETFWMDVR